MAYDFRPMLLLALQLAAQAPYVAFPQAGLDDPAAYEGYTTRVYRDARANAVQIYLDGKTGRVVHLWADALDESIGFTVRDSADATAAVVFGEGKATVGATGGHRWLRYALTVQGERSVRIGQFLLGSMRIERDFGYANRVRDPLDAPPFIVPEIARLAQALGRAPPVPRVTVSRTSTRWRVRVTQPSFDGKNHLALTLSGDAGRSRASVARGVVTVRPVAAGPIDLTTEIATDGPALTPRTRQQIFNAAFLRFADSAHSARLEREIRGFELLSSREKLMAGLPNYATYFGRDMLMTALLMEPI